MIEKYTTFEETELRDTGEPTRISEEIDIVMQMINERRISNLPREEPKPVYEQIYGSVK